MMTSMKGVIYTSLVVGAMGASIFAASTATADPNMNCGYVVPCSPTMPNPGPWGGQLQPTWDVPNWGGLSSGPTMCFNLSCQGAIPNPNGPFNFINPAGPVV